jgi:ribosome maturation factor RimP
MGALEEVRDLAEAVARRRNLTLWDVELSGAPGRQLLRVFVEGPEGVDLETVAEVSEEISRALDLRDPLPGRYTLEVSSPGLERNLKHPEHFAASVGRSVVVKTTEVLVGTSHRIEGVIAGANDDIVRLTAEDDVVEVPLDKIKQARTVFEWEKASK